MKRILFVDNDPDFLSTRAEFLENDGYEVIKASSIQEAQKYINELWIPIAILDIRLTDDDDEKDLSGLTLVRSENLISVVKIVLTNYPNISIVRELLQLQSGGLRLTVDVLSKQEGPDVMLETVRQAFKANVGINFELGIDWRARDCYSLAKSINPELSGASLTNRCEELEDLFRRLFYRKDHIRIDHMLWHRNGRVALIVFAFKEGAKPESFVVVCGQKAIVNEEAKRFEEFSPKAPSEIGTILSMKVETTHFAANAYTVTANDLENAQTLNEHYHSASEKAVNDTLTNLVQQTLQEWHQNKPIIDDNYTARSLYQQRLGLTEQYFSKTDFDERMNVILSQIAITGSRVTYKDKVLTFELGNQYFSFPDPLLIFPQSPHPKEEILAMIVPGTLSGDNILTDKSGHAWLTDFADAGLAPLHWNFVAIETAIRFDWTEANELLRRYELEYCLLNTDFAKPDIRDLEPMFRKPARAIQTIRKLAAQTVGNDVMAYHRGIFFQAVRRLADFNPANPMTSKELARLGHILLSMAMIAGKVAQVKEGGRTMANPVRSDQISLVDEKARIVMIGDRKERLPPQPFEVFRYLYLHANEVCSKEELLKVALKGKYDEANLHTLIKRIRNIIEDDSEYPRYITTEPNAGYRLILKPER